MTLSMSYHTYILQSEKTGKYYVGSTNNIAKRLERHNGSKVVSTKSDMPWKMIYSEKFDTLSEARKRELQIKNWKSRSAIERLINGPFV